VRTDPAAPKHKGISVLIIDMKAPGIEYRPISELTDVDYADFNEVFFSDVEVPRQNLVGDLNDGWRLSMGSLAHERAMLWIDYAYDLAETLDHLVAMGKEHNFDARQRDAVASVFVDQQALQALGYSGFAKFAKGRAAPEHSILKLFGSEALQRALLTGFEELGSAGLDLDLRGPKLWREGSFAFQYLRSFSATIPGGTSEIQRNIIAERLLGLPR
jgi:alkylation response protein AidB-like acyl-CoA dehydrogenase